MVTGKALVACRVRLLDSPASRKGDPELWKHVEVTTADQSGARFTGSQALTSQVYGYHARGTCCIGREAGASQVEEVRYAVGLHGICTTCFQSACKAKSFLVFLPSVVAMGEGAEETYQLPDA